MWSYYILRCFRVGPFVFKTAITIESYNNKRAWFKPQSSRFVNDVRFLPIQSASMQQTYFCQNISFFSLMLYQQPLSVLKQWSPDLKVPYLNHTGFTRYWKQMCVQMLFKVNVHNCSKNLNSQENKIKGYFEAWYLNR